jgi:hypothetical protein
MPTGLAQVMGKVLDWFQSMLVTLTDEEDFIEIGGIMLCRCHFVAIVLPPSSCTPRGNVSRRCAPCFMCRRCLNPKT